MNERAFEEVRATGPGGVGYFLDAVARWQTVTRTVARLRVSGPDRYRLEYSSRPDGRTPVITARDRLRVRGQDIVRLCGQRKQITAISLARPAADRGPVKETSWLIFRPGLASITCAATPELARYSFATATSERAIHETDRVPCLTMQGCVVSVAVSFISPPELACSRQLSSQHLGDQARDPADGRGADLPVGHMLSDLCGDRGADDLGCGGGVFHPRPAR